MQNSIRRGNDMVPLVQSFLGQNDPCARFVLPYVVTASRFRLPCTSHPIALPTQRVIFDESAVLTDSQPCQSSAEQ